MKDHQEEGGVGENSIGRWNKEGGGGGRRDSAAEEGVVMEETALINNNRCVMGEPACCSDLHTVCFIRGSL